jgi:hypothetical protein
MRKLGGQAKSKVTRTLSSTKPKGRRDVATVTATASPRGKTTTLQAHSWQARLTLSPIAPATIAMRAYVADNEAKTKPVRRNVSESIRYTREAEATRDRVDDASLVSFSAFLAEKPLPTLPSEAMFPNASTYDHAAASSNSYKRQSVVMPKQDVIQDTSNFSRDDFEIGSSPPPISRYPRTVSMPVNLNKLAQSVATPRDICTNNAKARGKGPGEPPTVPAPSQLQQNAFTQEPDVRRAARPLLPRSADHSQSSTQLSTSAGTSSPQVPVKKRKGLLQVWTQMKRAVNPKLTRNSKYQDSSPHRSPRRKGVITKKSGRPPGKKQMLANFPTSSGPEDEPRHGMYSGQPLVSFG